MTVSIDVVSGPDVMQEMREACHDMRQPIAGVLALASAALAEPGLSAAVGDRLKQIVGQAEWLADMIRHYLSGDPDEPGRVEADVVQVVGEAVAAEQLTWSGNLTIVWPLETVRSALHPVVLRRIVANVLGNATRAAGPSGTVTIEIVSRERSAMVVIEDSGPGFGKIPRGQGLGLAAVMRHFGQYGGELRCGPASRGGVRVSLCLPLLDWTQLTGQRGADAAGSL